MSFDLRQDQIAYVDAQGTVKTAWVVGVDVSDRVSILVDNRQVTVPRCDVLFHGRLPPLEHHVVMALLLVREASLALEGETVARLDILGVARQQLRDQEGHLVAILGRNASTVVLLHYAQWFGMAPADPGGGSGVLQALVERMENLLDQEPFIPQESLAALLRDLRSVCAVLNRKQAA